MVKQSKSKKRSRKQGTFAGAGVLGANARQIGATLAGAVLTEIVELAVERLMHKQTKDSDRTNHADSPNHADRTNHDDRTDIAANEANSNLFQSTAASESDKAKSTKPKPSGVDVLKSAANELSPVLAGVVDSLKTGAERSLDQTARLETDSATTIASNVLGTAQAVMSAANQTTNQTDTDTPGKKGKKKKKKKAKK